MRKLFLCFKIPYFDKVLFCCFLYAILGTFGYCQGLQIAYQSARFAAMGNSGVGVAKEASSLYFNPAAAAMLYGNEIQFGMANNKGFTTYTGGAPSLYSAVMDSKTQIPLYFYGTFQPKRGGKFTFGISLTNPYGLGVKWEDDWKGRFIVQQNSFNTFCIQPAVAFRVNEHLSLGAAFMYYVGDLQFQKSIPQTQIQGKEGWMLLQGKGNGYGANLGLHYRASERFSMGISYRSSANWNVRKGNAVFHVPISIDLLYPNSNFQTQIILPSQLSFGLSFMPVPKVLFILNVVKSGWKKWESSLFNFKDSLLNDILYERNYRNNFRFSGGAEFRVLKNCFLRVGSFYYLSPQKDDYVTPEMPDANRIGLTIGLGCNIKNIFSIDIAGQYDFTGDRTAQFKQANFAGTYDSNGYQFGGGIKYRF